MTIVEFLTARLDEREAIALAADPGPWEWVETGPPMSTQALVSHVGNGLMVVPSRTPDVYPSVANARFMELNHPAAVLADIAAKRAIVASCAEILPTGPGGFDAVAWDVAWLHARLLASVYADHLDYQQDWKP